jgi:ABC-type glycerol-3-phosphate transport system permease component
VFLALCSGALVLLFPLWWMISISLATPGEAMAGVADLSSFHFIPRDPQWGNYVDALKSMGTVHESAPDAASLGRTVTGDWNGFLDALSNTTVITTLCVLGQILSCSLVGYSFARLRFRGSSVMFMVVLSTMMLPSQVTMIPVFVLFRSFGWVNTILPLVVPSYFGSAFFIFMFRQFFTQIPQDLLDAARIDGANNVGIWWRIMLPMCRPVVAITAVFTFMGQWNDFMGPLIYLHTRDKGTLALALNSFRSQFGEIDKIHLLMAASVVTMIPCVLLFFVAQRQFIKGLNLGAIKG